MRGLALTSWLLLLASVVNAGLVDDIIDALKNAATCGSCHTLLVPLKGLAYLGDGAFTKAITAVCTTLNLSDDDVCEGAIGQHGPTLAYDIREISIWGKMGDKLCDAVFGLCQPPAVIPYKVPFPKAAPTNPKVFKSTGKAPFQVAHFSDVHVDRRYTPGADAICSKPLCCRNYPGQTSPPAQPAGPNGDYNCDTPPSLADSMFEAIRRVAPGNKFSIFTGDVIDAAIWEISKSTVTEDLEAFNNQMASRLNSPVYPAIGNHEAAPVNAFPRDTTAVANAQWIFDTQSAGWARWLNTAGVKQAAETSGSYSLVVPGTNLRIVSINTVYWYKQNYWLYDTDDAPADPNGILAFTVKQLQEAEDAGQRVWLVAHMPPGRQDALNDQSNYFDQVIQRYKNTIAAQFYGHDHRDQFALAYSDYNKRTAENAVSMGWIAPAVTPRSGNPAFKIYDVDPDTYEIMDARVYTTDLKEPGFQTTPNWKLYYSARAAYGPLVSGLKASDPLGPAFWHKVTEGFERNSTAFDMWNTFQSRGAKVQACDAECKKTTICNLRALRAENNCDDSKPGLQLKRGEPESDRVRDADLGILLSKATVVLSQKNPETEAQLADLKKKLHEILGDAE
ncbi:hypothetical protein EYR38_002064 [Pleurotus pulmonarius]|nr:hypothetical protein EYR38_002064 [Pleurotus pulmonarius]